jgi:hypothetical protein
MSDSSSDESAFVEYKYLLSKSKSKQKTDTVKNLGENLSAEVPKLSFTGSLQQPVCLDSDASSSFCSLLEVLPPIAAKKPASETMSKPSVTTALVASTGRNCDSHWDSSDSDSDDSILNAKPVFKTTTTTKKKSDAAAKKIGPHNDDDNNNNNSNGSVTFKQNEQERKKLLKLAEQERKKAERQTSRELRAAEKDAEKETRKRNRLVHQQARGNFATSEIVLLVDPPLFRRHEEFECYDWRQHEEITNHNCAVHEYRSAIGGSNCQALQWIRKSHVEGGAGKAWEELRLNNPNGYTHMDRLVIVFDDPKVFIELLNRTEQDTTDDDYPQLRQWLFRLEHSWRAAWPNAQSKRPSILLLLHQAMKELDRQWVKHRRLHKNSARQHATQHPPTTSDFHDAISWMMIQFQVECMCCESYEEIWTTALKMTRALSKSVYKKTPITELECVKRIKSVTHDSAEPLVKAKDVWYRQLQQLQGISETKARNLVRHYPTIQSLWRGYHDIDDDPSELVAGCLHNSQYQQKMSENIHRLLTSTNPEEII